MLVNPVIFPRQPASAAGRSLNSDLFLGFRLDDDPVARAASKKRVSGR